MGCGGDGDLGFKELYRPISKELDKVETELRDVCLDIGIGSLREITEHFFKSPGKRLRPVLVLLSAGTVNPQLSGSTNDSLIQLAVGVELIHSASLIHDDIIDGDILRRGQETLNKVYGRKIAVLAGDVLYARAFSIFSSALPKKFQKDIINLTQEMCAAEIDQAKKTFFDREMYLNIIKGKTASFMELCCGLGAELIGASEKGIDSLRKYGLNLGMAYQIIDDYIDGSIEALNNITLRDAQCYAEKAKEALSDFEDSQYKNSLIMMVNYILMMSHENVKNA